MRITTEAIMTNGEIVTSYREAKDKAAQVGILADLNVCSRDEIIEILKDGGVDWRELPRVKRKKGEAKDAGRCVPAVENHIEKEITEMEFERKDNSDGISGIFDEGLRSEYIQLIERYERIKKLNIRIEAAEKMREPNIAPKHICPDGLLREQQYAMEEYLHVLELRAVIEGIEL